MVSKNCMALLKTSTYHQQAPVSSKPAWSTQGNPGQEELHNKTPSHKKKKKIEIDLANDTSPGDAIISTVSFCREIGASVVTASLFTVARIWKQLGIYQLTNR